MRLTLCLLVLLAARPAAAQQLTARDQSALRAMFDSAGAELSSGRLDAWGLHFAKGAVVHRPNGPVAAGRDSIIAWARSLPIENVTFADVRVEGEGSIAYGTSSYTLKLRGQPADSGKQLVVFRRSPAGQWEAHAMSFNSSLPLPAEPIPVRN